MERTNIIKEINKSYKRVQQVIENAKYASATKIINKLYHQSIEIGYGKGIEQFHENLATILYYTHKNYLTLNSIKYLIKTYKKSKNKSKLYRSYRTLGVVLSRLGDFYSSYYYLKKSLEISENLKNKNYSDIVNIYSSLSFNSSNVGDFDKALKYINSGLSLLNTEKLIKNNLKIYTKANIIKVRVLIKQDNITEAKKLYNHLMLSAISYNRNELIYFDELSIQFKLRAIKVDQIQINSLLQTLLRNAINIQDIELRVRTLHVLKQFHTKNKNFELAYKYSNQLLKIQDYKQSSQMDLMNMLSFSTPIEKASEEFEIYLKKDLNIAAKYQANFFKNKINSKHFNLDILFTPAKSLSGDYLGTFNLTKQDNYFLFVLADVVGKGITASYISFMLDGIIKSIIYNTDSFNLKNMVNDINTILSDALNSQGFVSLWAGILDTKKKQLESINAGHLPTLILRKDKETIELNKGCTILGMFNTLPDFETETININNGDAIIAYSDGVTEAMDNKGELYEKKFNTLVSNYNNNRDFNFIRNLKMEIKSFQGSQSNQDDVSCLLIDFKN